MIRRVVVINDISDAKGGATALALESALQFRARGLDVVYLTGDKGENADLLRAGVAVVGLGHDRLLASGGSRALITGLFNRKAREMISQWIALNDDPFTIYHLHGWAQILSPSIFFALRPVYDRLILSAHDFFLVCPNGSYSFLKTGNVCKFRPLSISCVTSQCDRRNYFHKMWRVVRQVVHRVGYVPSRSPPVLAIHEAMRPFLVRGGIPDSSIVTIPNPVRPWSDRRIKAEAGDHALFVGRLEATKGPDLAAAACRQANVKLTLVGDGIMRAELEEQYPEFSFVGRQPSERIAEFARTARMLLMPSRYPEPYGLVAAEALWSGLPAIVSDTAFLADDILKSGAGGACDPRDARKFAAQIRALFGDDGRCKVMSERAYGSTRSIGLTPSTWVDALLEVYASRLQTVAARAPTS